MRVLCRADAKNRHITDRTLALPRHAATVTADPRTVGVHTTKKEVSLSSKEQPLGRELAPNPEILAEEMFGKNKTFPKLPSVKEMMEKQIVRIVDFAFTTKNRCLIIGPQGTGKTSFVKAAIEAWGARCVYIPAAVVSPENMYVPFPVDEQGTGRTFLETLFYREMMDGDEPKVVLIDEPGRADGAMMNVVMELIQEGSLMGKPVPGLVTVLACDNPSGMSYGRLNGMDFSQADRFATFQIGQADSPWQRALADEFADVDLSNLFKFYLRWSAVNKGATEILSPRVLSNVIWALLNDFPGKWGLPIMDGRYVVLTGADGEDITTDTIDKLASALGVSSPKRIGNVFDAAIRAALGGHNVYLEGAPGIGKTSRTKALLEQHGVDVAYFSVPAMSPEDMAVPFPDDLGDFLEMLIVGKLARPGPKIVVLDESRRGDRRIQNALMELIQERTVGGMPVPGMIGTIALNNPRMIGSYRLAVGRVDLAQAARFRLNIQLDATDTKFDDYLVGKYGDSISPFIEWWKEDLDDDGRALISARGLERMYDLNRMGMGLEEGKPFVSGEYVPVPLVELEARLADRPIAKLSAIAENIDEWVARLAAGSRDDPDDLEAHLAVYNALNNAAMPHLEKYRQECIQLIAQLSDQYMLQFLTPKQSDRKNFWFKVVQAARVTGASSS